MDNNEVQNVSSEEKVTKGVNKGVIAIVAFVAVVVLVFAVISLTSKGNKTLSCSITQEESGMKAITVMDMNFTNDIIKDLTMTQTFELGEMANLKDQLFDYVKKNYESEFAEYDLDLSFDSTDDKIIVTAKGDNGVFSLVGATDEDKYDNVKKELEELGFTCK